MLNPALAAATVGVWAWRKLIYSLIWQSVMWRPGKLRFLIGVKNPLPIRSTTSARKRGSLQGPAGPQIRNSGRATPSRRHASADSRVLPFGRTAAEGGVPRFTEANTGNREHSDERRAHRS